jgi:hypothetical protein
LAKYAVFLAQAVHLAEVVLNKGIGCVTNALVVGWSLGMRDFRQNHPKNALSLGTFMPGLFQSVYLLEAVPRIEKMKIARHAVSFFVIAQVDTEKGRSFAVISVAKE